MGPCVHWGVRASAEVLLGQRKSSFREKMLAGVGVGWTAGHSRRTKLIFIGFWLSPTSLNYARTKASPPEVFTVPQQLILSMDE